MDDDDIRSTPARRFRSGDLLVVGLEFISDVSVAVASALTFLRDLAAMHTNYLTSRDAFHQQAALEIETLTSGDLDG